MQHVMNKDEITEAFTDFMNKNGITTEDKHINLTLAPGGVSATIEISATPIKQKRAARKPAAAKKDVVTEPADTEAVVEDETATANLDTSADTTYDVQNDDKAEDDDNLFGTGD